MVRTRRPAAISVPFWADIWHRPPILPMWIVIPVPLHWLRRFRRGYNQAAVLSEAIAGVLGVPVLKDVLVRSRRTRSQTSLSAEDRLKNVSGVFSLRQVPQARHILLVDDTFTTGATLAACHQALRQALDSSVRISIATLAVVEG